MSDTIGTVGTKIGTAPARVLLPAPESQKQETTKVSAVPQIQRISPTIKSDPIAGVLVTQYLNGKGEVQTQLPSAAAVAYLRVGLTAMGEQPKHEDVFASELAIGLVA